MNPEGTLAIWQRTVGVGKQSDIVYSTRATSDSAWSAVAPLTGAATPAYEFTGAYDSVDAKFYFSKGNPTKGDIFEGSYAAGALSGVTAIAINDPNAEDHFPVVSADGKTLYFSSTRESTDGTRDVFMATRPSRSTIFSNVVKVLNVNSAKDDDPTGLSVDGCRLYLSSDPVSVKAVVAFRDLLRARRARRARGGLLIVAFGVEEDRGRGAPVARAA